MRGKMNEKFLSKSGYCQAVQCEKILWLNKFKSELIPKGNDSAMESGKKVGELAKGLFGDYVDIPYDKDINVRIEKTQKAIEDNVDIITEASFEYNGNFCSVDILKSDDDGVEIYEVKSTTKLENIDMNDPAFQYFVLSNLGLNVKKVCVVYLNSDYIRGKKLDLNQLFHIEDVTDDVLGLQEEIGKGIGLIGEFMQAHDKDSEPVTDIGEHCFNPRQCAFWDYCTRDLPKPNVFDIAKMKTDKKFEKYHEGKVSFADLENDPDITTQRFVEQIDFELHDREPKIDKEAIKGILDSLKYPLYLIDYETCAFAIPEFESTKPYQQIPFQYSLHIIRSEGATPEHREFLAEIGDENMIRNFAESMIGDLSENGSVIVYNKGFESGVNKRIGAMYPDLAGEIERINGNIVDFMAPFSKRQYYTRQMQGSYSIKKVLPALYPDDEELYYANLDGVHNGTEASSAFLSLKDKPPQEQSEIRQNLLRYCELDTYAMVKIWEKFRQVTGYE